MRIILSIILFNILIAHLTAQNEKIGLVLSGGGAKGLAHIGVLKALEEHDIPIDYITGTSIGALIGGMYASGFTVDSIISIVKSDEFQNWATGEIDEKYNYYYKKQQPNASWISLRFNVDSIWQPKLPANLVSPVQMDFAGMVYFAGVNVASNKDFDSLYIPFRCVASDIEKKKPVVLKQGDVYDAIRASTTYPFVFKPIMVDGRLLFDGGIYNNYPVDVMKQEFNPDYIIGSAVGMIVRPLRHDDLVSQLENLVVFPTDYEIPDSIGLTIRPEVPEVGLTNFRKADELIELGYEATVSNIDKIRKDISVKVEKDERQQKREIFAGKKPELLFDDVSVEGVNPSQEQYIRDLLLMKDVPIDPDAIKPFYFKLLAEDHIDLIKPRAIYNQKTGYYTLSLDITVDRSLVLQFGGNISSSPVNQAYIDVQYLYLGYRASTIGLNAYFGRFYSSLQVKGRMDFPEPAPFFLKTSLTMSYYDYFRSTTTFFEDRTPSYLLQNYNFYEFLAGIPAGNNGKITGGLTTGRNRDDYFQTHAFGRTDTADRTTLHYISPYLGYERYSQNCKQFPSRGSHLSVSLRYTTGDEKHIPGSTAKFEDIFQESHEWFQFRVFYENFFRDYGLVNLAFYSELLLSNKDFLSNYTSTLLSSPAFRYVPQTRIHFLPNYRAHNYAVAGLKTVINITDNTGIWLGGYLFQPYRKILRDPDDYTALYGEPFDVRYFLGSASIVVNTAIGPLSFSMSYYDRHDEKFAFSLDFGYLIFHNLPLR